MSHVATVDIEIKSLESLRAACAALGLDFREGQKTYKWYGTWMRDYSSENAAYRNGIDPSKYGHCDHAIGVPGNDRAYEVGVVLQQDGSYKLVWDFYCGGFGLMDLTGHDCSKLMKAYVGDVAKRTLRKKGYSFVGTKELADGSVELLFNHA